MEDTVICSINGRCSDEIEEISLAKRVKQQWKKTNELGRAIHNRVIRKRGQLNVALKKIPDKTKRYLKDLGYTLLNTRWRWIFLTILIVNTMAYFLFAGLWMLLSWSNGDLNAGENHTYCVKGSTNFTGYLLLSIETLTTVGFGNTYPLHYCSQVWVILMLETLANVTINGALVTMVYVKVTRPLTKDSTRLFSKTAVICLRDERLCFIYRIRDRIGKHRVGTKIKSYFIKKCCTDEGILIPDCFLPLKLKFHGLLMWPLEIVHEIDEDSPLWEVSAVDLTASRFEIFVVIEGDSILTGQRSKSQSSYIGSEILWGRRFQPCIVEDETDEYYYYVDYSLFNQTVCVDTPLCSGKDLKRKAIETRSFGHNFDFEYT